MTCAIQRPACLLIARLAAVISLKISGKVTLRGKRRLTGIQFIWAVCFAGIFAIAESVFMGAGNSLSHYMEMRGHFPGNDSV
ncbi:hypothetical protein B6257_16615 [Bacillus velezensis]|nr:hypothetical protein B6257_16615 [Bacillus velezensis]